MKERKRCEMCSFRRDDYEFPPEEDTCYKCKAGINNNSIEVRQCLKCGKNFTTKSSYRFCYTCKRGWTDSRVYHRTEKK